MKKEKLIAIAAIVFVIFAFSSCTRINPGYAGFKISYSGDYRGTDSLPQETGWVWYMPGFSTVKEFPTFMQHVIYSEGKEIEREVQEISDSLHEETGTFRELLHPGLRRALFISVALALLVQLTGISPLDFYLPDIFRSAGFSNASDALLQVSFVTCWMWICTVIAIWLVDRIGRRPLLIGGVAGMAIGMLKKAGLGIKPVKP